MPHGFQGRLGDFSAASRPRNDMDEGKSDLEGKGGVEQMQFVDFQFDFFSHPGEIRGEIKGINIQELIQFFLNFLLEFAFVLDL